MESSQRKDVWSAGRMGLGDPRLLISLEVAGFLETGDGSASRSYFRSDFGCWTFF
jgi:hypothetical protein